MNTPNKIHYIVNGNSKTGICGLKHANLVTTDVLLFFKHTNKCELCAQVLNKISSQYKKPAINQ